jgi:hypothetical protein
MKENGDGAETPESVKAFLARMMRPPWLADGSISSVEEAVNALLVMMVLGIWFVMNHHNLFVQPPWSVTRITGGATEVARRLREAHKLLDAVVKVLIEMRREMLGGGQR